MNNYSVSKVWIVVVLTVLLSGGFLVWQYVGEPKKEIKKEIKVPEEKIVEKRIKVPLPGGMGEEEFIEGTIKFKEERKEDEWNTLTIYEYNGYEAGFSIDYPSEFEVSYGAIGDAPICAEWPFVDFSSPEKRKIPGYGEKEMMRVEIDFCVKLGWASTFQEWIDSQKGGRYPVKKEEEIVVDNKPAVKLTDVASGFIRPAPEYKQLLVHVYINRNEMAAYEITARIDFEKQDVYLPIFNKMLSSFKFIKPSTTRIISVSPKENTIDVSHDTKIQIKFNEEIDVKTVDTSTIKVIDKTMGRAEDITQLFEFSFMKPPSLPDIGTTVILSPRPGTFGTGKHITVKVSSGVKDITGKSIKPKEWNFTTVFLEIPTGKVKINPEEIANLQKECDKIPGYYYLRDPEGVIRTDAFLYGFTIDDIERLKEIYRSTEEGIVKYQIPHKGKDYIVTVIQPVVGEGKIWAISEIQEK